MSGHAAYVFDLGRRLGREQVWFTDDRTENVAAAREFGWASKLFILTP